MRRYRVAKAPAGWPEKLPFSISRPDGEFGVGKEFEADLTPEEEEANLASGLLELQPSKYRVCGDSSVFENEPGSEFEAAIPLAQERLLLGVHIERVEDKPKTRKAKEE